MNRWFTHTSVLRRLCGAFVLLIAVAAAIAAAILASMLYINRQAFSILDEHINFNLYYLQLDAVQAALRRAQSTGNIDDMSACRNEGAALNSYAQWLRTDYPLRKVIDLQYMTETYLEKAETALRCRQSNQIESSFAAYRETEYLRDLIFDQYSTVYNKTQDVSQRQTMELMRSQEALNKALVVSMLALTAGGLFFAWLFSRRFVKPILALDEAAQQISGGKLDLPPLPVLTGDEMGRLTATFNEMTMRLAELVEHYKNKAEVERRLKQEEVIRLRTQSRLRDSELKLMQARINPHFLFNTLNMVSQSAYLENAGDTVEITNKLAALLRYSLDNLDRVVTLADEMENIRDYLYIQKRRFEDRIAFQIPEANEKMEACLPSMILQPLVENAIIHGLRRDQEDALLGIDVDGGPDRVRIRVFDNGRGLTGNKVRELNDLAAHPSEGSGESIGVNNVAARLSLFFGGACTMRFASIPGAYTEVVIEFPLLREVTKDVSPIDNRG